MGVMLLGELAYMNPFLQIGAALTALRDEGILIVGSGSSFHNMQALMAGATGKIPDKAMEAAKVCSYAHDLWSNT